uniref:Spaetzle domain-containing protein n=1 Tax=Strigamia maritima TaxID=126957 RepID=T1JBV2_STRMM
MAPPILTLAVEFNVILKIRSTFTSAKINISLSARVAQGYTFTVVNCQYKYVVCVLVVSVFHFGEGKTDATNGLNCITLSDETKTRVCTGTNKEYIGNREVARSNKSADMDVQTRFFRPPCRGDSQCTAFQQTYAPTLLTNTAGQERYIYQDEDYGFKQSVRIVTCGAGPCGYGGQCKQSYREYTLIAWDPYLDYCNPVLDVFSVPDCCGCNQDSNRNTDQGSTIF